MSRDYQQYSQEWRPDEKQGIIMYMYFFLSFFESKLNFGLLISLQSQSNL